MEQCIKDQLFAKTAVAVHIVEEYMLSGQYTAEALMNEYRESIILELKEKVCLHLICLHRQISAMKRKM